MAKYTSLSFCSICVYTTCKCHKCVQVQYGRVHPLVLWEAGLKVLVEEVDDKMVGTHCCQRVFHSPLAAHQVTTSYWEYS